MQVEPDFIDTATCLLEGNKSLRVVTVFQASVSEAFVATF